MSIEPRVLESSDLDYLRPGINSLGPIYTVILVDIEIITALFSTPCTSASP